MEATNHLPGNSGTLFSLPIAMLVFLFFSMPNSSQQAVCMCVVACMINGYPDYEDYLRPHLFHYNAGLLLIFTAEHIIADCVSVPACLL